MKKGFTLIELLSVIVLLAIIILVAFPIIGNIIENVRKSTVKNNANALVSAAMYYYATHESEIDTFAEFKIINKKQQGELKLSYKGEIKNAYIRLNKDSKVALCVDNGKYFALKNLNNDEIEVGSGICTGEFNEDNFSYEVSGFSNYVGIRLNVKEYGSKNDLPEKSSEGYIGVITNQKVTDYYFSHEGIENPKEGNVWIVQNSNAEPYIKNDRSKIAVSCVMQYENGKWVPKESYVYNDETWIQLSKFDNTEYVWNYDYTGNVQTFTAPYSGYYRMEAWGAQGGNISNYTGGLGAYTKGDIYLNQGQELFIFVGGQPTTATGGYNGGGNGYRNAGGGGGSTDIRTVNAAWNDAYGLRTRIMVAAGGAGASVHDSNWYTYGGAGGGLIGLYGRGGSESSYYKAITPSSQSYGGMTNINYSGANGGFGYGGKSYSGTSSWSAAGGGSGWYGGAGGAYAGSVITGGSSFISGHLGCSAVEATGLNIGTSISFTGLFFENTVMIDGEGYTWTNYRGNKTLMPSKNDTSDVVGNSGNGYVKITLKTPLYKSEETLKSEKQKINIQYTYDFAQNYQIFEAPENGTYKFELWGAEGSSVGSYAGGKGAYTKGEIYLEKDTKLYIFVGSNGYSTLAGWNGGGAGYGSAGGSGGGATDVRTVATSTSTAWNETSSLLSRIMVAAGGAGASSHNSSWAAYGGAGGGLTGKYGSGGSEAKLYKVEHVASQSYGGIPNANNSGATGGFGYGGKSYTGQSGWNAAGGGSGWYGGAGGSYAGSVMSGGSSYISGHNGCNSVDEFGMHTGSAYSWTNYIFEKTKMIDGDGYNWTNVMNSQEKMPEKYTTSTMVGNSGNGYAKITLVKKETKENYIDNKIKNENEWTYSYRPSEQKFVVPRSGNYQIELWGAQGGTVNNSYLGGYGGYTKGKIYLEKDTILYLHVGSQAHWTTGGYNGGGNGFGANGRGGGGATDIRTNSGAWNDSIGLRSRIMVAAGGAGTSAHNTSTWLAYGGAAGGLSGTYGSGGSDATAYKALSVSTQISGGKTNTNYPGTNGGFGIAGRSYNGTSDWHSAGGGSGWYGGAGGAYAGSIITGGSSYVSGHNGCIGINSTGTPLVSEAAKVEDSYSWTNYKFTNTTMIDGNGYKWTTSKSSNIVYMKDPYTGKTVTGNSGDGYARITYID